MTTNTHVYMLGPSQEIQVIACLDISNIFDSLGELVHLNY